MWVRNTVLATAAVVAVTLSWTCPAQAQRTAPKLAPPAPLATQVSAPAATPAVEHVFTPPVVLGQAWTTAVRTLVDGVKQLVDKDVLQTEGEVCPLEPPAATSEGPRAPITPRPAVPVWHPVWSPAALLRDALGPSAVQIGPVDVAPPTEAAHDARGEHAVLLGARMDLPWMVP